MGSTSPSGVSRVLGNHPELRLAMAGGKLWTYSSQLGQAGVGGMSRAALKLAAEHLVRSGYLVHDVGPSGFLVSGR